MAFNGLHPEPIINLNPVYREIPKHEWPIIFENSFMNNAVKFLMTDDNMKPMHIEKFAKNTEFHIIRGSDTLLLIVGESWTYGESLKGIGTGAGMFNLVSQLEGCMGPRMAEVTGWDLYQFAIPGNCNLYMHMELERILKHVATLGYKQVKVVLQMTENSRELPIGWSENVKNHPIRNWFNCSKESEIEIRDWLKMYDEIFFESYHNILNNFKACPIEGIFWRNFTNTASRLTVHRRWTVSEKRDYCFKMIEPTMIAYTAKLVNHDHTPALLTNAMGFNDYIDKIGKKIYIKEGKIEFFEKQMDLIEKTFDYVRGRDVNNLIYHNTHPTKFGHLVWAHHLIRQCGWKDI